MTNMENDIKTLLFKLNKNAKKDTFLNVKNAELLSQLFDLLIESQNQNHGLMVSCAISIILNNKDLVDMITQDSAYATLFRSIVVLSNKEEAELIKFNPINANEKYYLIGGDEDSCSYKLFYTPITKESKYESTTISSNKRFIKKDDSSSCTCFCKIL